MAEISQNTRGAHVGLRVASLVALVAAVAYFWTLTSLERASEPVVHERTVTHVRHAWQVITAEGKISGYTEKLEPADSVAGEKGSGAIDLVFDPISNRLLSVDGDGKLRGLNTREPTLDGRAFDALVTGVAPLPDGRVVFCLGRSGFSTDYFLLLVDPSKPGAAEVRVPTGFCTTQLVAGDSGIFYSTKNARVARVSLEGHETWKRVLPQVPTALAAGSNGVLAAGDERGSVTLCSAQGEVVRSIAASEFPIVALTFLNSDALLAVDGRADVRVLDVDGRILRRFELGIDAGRIRAAVSRGGRVELITDSGRILEVTGIERQPRFSEATRTTMRVAGTLLLVLIALTAGAASSRRVAQRSKRVAQQALTGRAGYLLVLPTFVLLAIFCYYPMLTALSYSFGNFSLTAPWEFAGWGNFRSMLDDPYLSKGVGNMLVLLGTGLVKMIVLPLLAAELVFWLPSERLQQFFRSAVIFPAVVPGVVLVLVWKMIYDPYSGLINMTLHALGWDGATHAWLGEERFALWSVVFYNFPWINLLIFLIFLGGLIQVDRSIFEAVEMDGASIWQRFWHVDLPALRPKLNVAITLIFIWSVQDFASVLILTGGGPGTATFVPALQMFQQISDGHNLGYSSAIGLVLFLAVVAFTLVSRRLNREEEN